MRLFRYWLFMYPESIPSGGMQDLFQTTDSLQECRRVVKEANKENRYYEILDSVEQRIVETNIPNPRKREDELYKWLNRAPEKSEPKPPGSSLFH